MANNAADSSLLSHGFEARQQYPTQPQDACFSLLVPQDQSHERNDVTRMGGRCCDCYQPDSTDSNCAVPTIQLGVRPSIHYVPVTAWRERFRHMAVQKPEWAHPSCQD